MFERILERALVFFVVFTISLFWLADVVLTVQHESAHRQICKAFGGENITTYTNYSFAWTSGETFCSNISSGRGLELQMRNEIVGYHVEALVYALFLLVFFVVAYAEVRLVG